MFSQTPIQLFYSSVGFSWYFVKPKISIEFSALLTLKTIQYPLKIKSLISLSSKKMIFEKYKGF